MAMSVPLTNREESPLHWRGYDTVRVHVAISHDRSIHGARQRQGPRVASMAPMSTAAPTLRLKAGAALVRTPTEPVRGSVFDPACCRRRQSPGCRAAGPGLRVGPTCVSQAGPARGFHGFAGVPTRLWFVPLTRAPNWVTYADEVVSCWWQRRNDRPSRGRPDFRGAHRILAQQLCPDSDTVANMLSTPPPATRSCRRCDVAEGDFIRLRKPPPLAAGGVPAMMLR